VRRLRRSMPGQVHRASISQPPLSDRFGKLCGLWLLFEGL